MSNAYLDLLPLPPAARDQLAGLGVPSPEALLSMMRAAPQDFERLLGPELAREVADDLEVLIGARGRQELEHLPLPQAPLGARLDEPPRQVADFGTRERDRLFEVYQQLQREAARDPGARRRLAAVEAQLNVLMAPVPAVRSGAGSPVAWLVPYLAQAPFRVAPERAGELHDLLERRGLSLQFRDAGGPQVVLAAAPGGPVDFGQRVVFDLEATTRWWAYAVTYRDLVLACVEVRWGPGGKIGRPLPPALVQRVRAMSEPGPASLQRWGVPPPSPAEPATGPPSAEELFLAMGGDALLREIDRSPHPDAVDSWAAEWVLADWRSYGAGADDRVFATRLLGALFALSCLTEEGRAQGRRANRPARLLHVLSQFVEDGGTGALGWWAACWLVLLHREAAGKQTPWAELATGPREFLQAAAQAEAGQR